MLLLTQIGRLISPCLAGLLLIRVRNEKSLNFTTAWILLLPPVKRALCINQRELWLLPSWHAPSFMHVTQSHNPSFLPSTEIKLLPFSLNKIIKVSLLLPGMSLRVNWFYCLKFSDTLSSNITRETLNRTGEMFLCCQEITTKKYDVGCRNKQMK